MTNQEMKKFEGNFRIIAVNASGIEVAVKDSNDMDHVPKRTIDYINCCNEEILYEVKKAMTWMREMCKK